MRELPDIVVHVEHLERRLVGATFTGARIRRPKRLLADRALSRLLTDDWPRTIEELEEGRAGR